MISLGFSLAAIVLWDITKSQRRRKETPPMTTRPRKKNEDPAEDTHAGKDFAEVAERVFADDTPPQPLYGTILDDAEEEAA